MRRTIEITTRIGCPYKCSFCPQPQLSAAYKSDRHIMTLAVLQQCLDGLPRDVEIHFSGFSEPFSNRHTHEMFCLVRHMGFRELHIYSTLMGIHENQVECLKVSNPNVFRVHVPDTKAFVVSSESWLRAFTVFTESRIPATFMAMGEVPSDIMAHLSARGVIVETPDMLSRGGNLWKKKDLSGGIKCTMDRWHSNVLLPDGSVWGCCMDYSLSVPLGNLLQDSYGHVLTKGLLWRSNMGKNAAGTICAHCEWAAPL